MVLGMLLEVLYWFLIPLIVMVYITVKSISISRKNKNLTNLMLTSVLLILVIYSTCKLYGILQNEWRTNLPHIGIIVAVIIYIIQFYINKRNTIR